MAGMIFPGPICWLSQLAEINDGTMVRAVSNPPGQIGMSPARSTNTSAAQTSSCKYVEQKLSGTVSVPDASFNRLRLSNSIARLSAPSLLSAYQWPYGPPTNAVQQVITIDGHDISVIRPPDSVIQQNNLPTINQIAEALRAIPRKQRQHTTIVKLSPVSNPGSRSGYVVAGEGGANDIILYPVAGTQSQNDFDYRIMHESGHNYQSSLWNSAQSVAEWSATVTSDGNSPSPYARTGTGEDFCEFYVLFVTSRGTNCALRLKTLYPARWKKMTGYFLNT
jgi:hypothetical protein